MLRKDLPRRSQEGILGRHHMCSLDPLTRRPARVPEPPRRREGRVEDHPADPRRLEVPTPARYLPRPDLAEEILLDKIEEWLYLRRGRQDKVYQPSGEEPLTARIRTSQLPMGWMTPMFSRFDGKGDPDQYLMEYRILMAPNNSNDQLTQIFKQSLKGQALLWYVRLRKNLINSFEALAWEFSCQHDCNRIQEKIIDAFFDLNIGPKESFKYFVTWFREDILEVIEVDKNEGIICATFKNALLKGHPMEVDLILKPKVYFFDLYERAQKLIRVEVDAVRGKRTVAVYAVAEVPVKALVREKRTVPQELRKVNPPPFDWNKGKAIAFSQPKFPRNPSREYT